MKYLILIFMTIVLTQNIFAQNAFFQRVKYDGKTSGIERVSPVKNKYMGLLVFNTGSTWGLFDSLGRLQSYSYIDSFDNKGYRVDYTHNHHSSYIIGVNIFLPGLKFFSPAQHLLTPCLTKLDCMGHLLNTYDYNYNNPAEFSSVTLSADNKLLACGRVYTDTITGPLICDALVTKLDTNGNELWRYRYTGPYAQDPGGIIATPDSGAIVALASGPWPGVNEVRVIKLSKSGQLQWMKKTPLPIGIYGVRLIDYEPVKQEVVLITYVYQDTMIIGKYDSSMKAIWEIRQKITDANGGIRLSLGQLIKDRSGYIGCGIDQRAGNGSDNIGWLLKIDNNGKQLWEANYPGKFKDLANHYSTYFFGIDTTNDSGYIISGGTMDSLHHLVGVLVKVDSLGCLTVGQCETHYFTSIAPLFEELGFSLYPNPANNTYVTLTLDGVETNKVYHYSITGILGELLQEGEISKRETELDIRALSSGMYVVQVFGNDGEQWSGRFVKE
jgi:hypothetical protein